ncbi:MAG TPA: peptide-methionine (S)-S-oxide reductase MsrA [Candidatus Eisenbacteria bacterium]|jgi:peptide-methionine (S)-S-oxide reductase
MRIPTLLSALLIHSSFAVAHAAGAGPAKGTGPAGAAPGTSTAATTEKATFAGGCFWCMETAFEGLPGVVSVISGYTGGPERNPTYDQVSSKTTGHAESVQITYDPRQITYAQLLDYFWHNVDPTDTGGQFCDRGPEYRSEIFYHDATQKRLAEESKRQIESTPHRFKKPIVTRIVAATEFWPAEEYHQDFYKKDPVRYHGYRFGCGRDRRLTELWGKPGRQGEGK